MMLGMDDDAGAEKTDAGEDSLDDSAGGIGEFRAVAKWIRQHHDHGGGKTHQAKRLNPIGLPCRSRVRPIKPPATVATPRRSTISGPSSKAMSLSRFERPISVRAPSYKIRRSAAWR